MKGLACLGLAQALEMELEGPLVALPFFTGEESQVGKEGACTGIPERSEPGLTLLIL